jgi:GrpB-like predicted nucleotidyltransferase (UPF0157 family)
LELELDKDRFLSFIETGIGLPEDNLVRLIPHNTNWAKVFADEAIRIHNALKINSLKLHHGGSTAIPHIVAKPIIDIIGEIDHLEELDNNKEALEKIGYEYKGEYGIKNRRYSVLYNLKKVYCLLPSPCF